VADKAAKDCILFLWSTAPLLAESLEVVAAWGFEYKSCAIWDKERIGMGHYFRIQHELLLIATRGSPGTPPDSMLKSSVYREARGKHSAKPEHFRKTIESYYPSAKRIELFARKASPGWAAWGNEAEASTPPLKAAPNVLFKQEINSVEER
jgi:N6-adenosine-specific RNA methylase IME4